MSRVQLALNVENLEQSIAFYSKLFDTTPTKIRPGYANFAIATPPLKLVLIEGGGEAGTINHLGVEVATTDEVAAATARLSDASLATLVEEQTSCCFAVQDKVWVDSPDGSAWEIYTVLADAEAMGGDERCCTTESIRIGATPHLESLGAAGEACTPGDD